MQHLSEETATAVLSRIREVLDRHKIDYTLKRSSYDLEHSATFTVGSYVNADALNELVALDLDGDATVTYGPESGLKVAPYWSQP